MKITCCSLSFIRLFVIGAISELKAHSHGLFLRIRFLLVPKIGPCEHTANDLPTFSPQKRNLEIGPSGRLLPIFGTKNRIVGNGPSEILSNLKLQRKQNKFCSKFSEYCCRCYCFRHCFGILFLIPWYI